MIETKMNIELSENMMKKLKKDPVAYERYKNMMKNPEADPVAYEAFKRKVNNERLYEKHKKDKKNS